MDRIRAQIAAEVDQAIGRPRAVRRNEDNKVKVIVLGPAPIEMPVDKVVRYDELTGGSPQAMRLELAWLRGDGVLPLSTPKLAALYPDLWSTPKAAEDNVKAHFASGTTRDCSDDGFVGTLVVTPGGNRATVIPGPVT
jgi:hypothetical protein